MCRTIKNGVFLLIGIQTTWTFRWAPATRGTHCACHRHRHIKGMFDPVSHVSFCNKANQRDIVNDYLCVPCSARSSDQDFDLYNDNEEEMERDDIDLGLALHENGDNHDGKNEMLSFTVDTVESAGENREDSKKLIECHASILLPFPADVAFDAFSDLTRQP
jgi:hypothetical protein